MSQIPSDGVAVNVKPSVLRGQCLCGVVSFEIGGALPKLYQCHCSLCRKQSGAVCSTATIVAVQGFRWLAGEELISSWAKETGFRSDFCSRCGTSVPNPLRQLPYVWVPAGLLDDTPGFTIAAQVFIGSKASWDPVSGPGARFETIPPLEEFIAHLHEGTAVPRTWAGKAAACNNKLSRR